LQVFLYEKLRSHEQEVEEFCAFTVLVPSVFIAPEPRFLSLVF